MSIWLKIFLNPFLSAYEERKFGTSKEVRQLMRKYDMSRSEAKTHRLQLHQTHQTAIKIKAKERRKDLDLPPGRSEQEPLACQMP